MIETPFNHCVIPDFLDAKSYAQLVETYSKFKFY
jgi:hypothetical protein